MNIDLAIECAMRWEFIVTEQCPWLMGDPNESMVVEFMKMASMMPQEFRRVVALKRLKHKSGKF
ncbi:MAG: hypothetical protein V4501_11140 [Pseudomonadota bacterium]